MRDMINAVNEMEIN